MVDTDLHYTSDKIVCVTTSLRSRLVLCTPTRAATSESNILSEACRLGLLKNAPEMVPSAEQLRGSRKNIVSILEHSRAQYQKWYNKDWKPLLFKKDDWVLLSTKNLRQRRPSRKFANKYEGPFQIEEVVGDHGLAYRLRLPSRLRMHPTFPITSLETYRERPGEEPSSPIDTSLQAEPSYEVETILGHVGNENI
jgi:hypothetical protein